jgi:hypothetical protein
VVANLERILYEVMGDAPLDLFKLIAVDTDSRPKDDEPPPGGRRSVRFPAHESNTGKAIDNLRHALGSDFAWCPQDLVLDGEGAGNRRAGGRMLLFNKFPEIWQMIQNSVHEACEAAAHGQTRETFERKFGERGLTMDPVLINPAEAIVYVVGTLAGGTCSGMCVDLGYAISDAAPGAKRVGTFFLPARTESSVYLENTWATLKDLEYFCDNPSAFRTVWRSAAGAKQRFQAANSLPYDCVYLLSTSDENGALKMRYAPNSHAPLVQMSSLQLACALFGMGADISARHVDGQEQIQCRPKNRFFLNYNLRAVSYPKYDLSEAAACRIIESIVCGGWLNPDAYQTASGGRTLNADDVRMQGRRLWNDRFEPVWRGMTAAVDLSVWVNRLMRRASTEPDAELHYEFTDTAPGTIYSKVFQTLPSRRSELQKAIREGLGKVYSENHNLRYAELYVEGIRAELAYTIRFWDEIGTPNRSDANAWSALVRKLVQNSLSTASISARMLNAQRQLLTDELEMTLTRLQMYLMKQVLADLQTWMDGELNAWMKSLRETIESVRSLASARATTLKLQLEERIGPILKISRSKSETLQDEMEKLAHEPVRPTLELLSTVEGEFQGLFAVKPRQEASDVSRIYLALKNNLQSPLLRRLQDYGMIDVATEAKTQGRIPQVADHYREAQGMSVATQIRLKKSRAAVPSYILAKKTETADAISDALQPVLGFAPEGTSGALPLLDHMVVFYQEGACSVPTDTEYHAFPDVLTDAGTYREHYEIKMKERKDILDPLGPIKAAAFSAKSGSEK